MRLTQPNTMDLHEANSGGEMVLLKAALVEVQRGDRQRATTLVQMACRRNPNNQLAWLWRASLAEDPAEVADCFRQILRIAPDHKIAREWLSKCEQEAPEAESDGYDCPFCGREEKLDFDRCPGCNAVVTLDLDLFKGLSGVNQQILKDAIESWKEQRQDPFNMHYWLGVAYLNLLRSDLALTHLEDALRLRPSEPELGRQVEKLRKRRLVLVVDDSATIRSLVTRALEQEGYRTIEASSGMEALGKLGDRGIDAVILDIGMPMIDGYKVCRIIKDHPKTKLVPVIMLSGHDGFFDKVRGRLAGATDYLTKPLKPHLLIAAVEKHVAAPVAN